MSGSRVKRKQSVTKQAGTGKRLLHFIFSWQFLVVVVGAILLGTLIFLHETITKVLVRSLGLGLILAALWLLMAIWVLWRHRFGIVLRNWNRWLGALLLSIGVLGLLVPIRPQISISGESLADVSVVGTLGQLIAGTSYTWARLLGFLLSGVILVIPGHTVNFVKGFFNFLGQATINIVTVVSLESWDLLRDIFAWLRSASRRSWSRIAGLFKSRPATVDLSDGQTKTLPDKQVPVKETAPAFNEPEQNLTQTALVEEITFPVGDRQLPPLEILDESPKFTSFAQADDGERAKLIEEALASYGVEVKVTQINPGPSVTQFGVEPGWVRKYRRVVEKDQAGKPKLNKDGHPIVHMEEISKTRVKVERITSLANDLALALAVPDIRIEAPVPGKALVGVEVPNVSTAMVSLRGVIGSGAFSKVAAKSKLAVALGQGAGGEAIAGDLAKMPHLLIAGATGSGKTVCLNCIVSCLLAQTTPAEVRMVLIDPKRVEMVTFKDVPHLITPVVVDADKAVDSLRRVTMEMDNRYRKFAAARVRNIDAYNRSPEVTEQMPYIVVIIDELADLMMTTPDVVEPLICRLAQLARATGIHLIVATQRPSVDVITGLIKANFPTRISFAVVSSIDSRTILDTIGAEKLLGRGDMLYIPPEASKPKRIRGCFVSDEEMDRLVEFWKDWAAEHFPLEADHLAQEFASLPLERLDADPFMEQARQLCDESAHISASLLQRKLHIGYQRASRLMEQLAEEGLIESGEYGRPWEGEP